MEIACKYLGMGIYVSLVDDTLHFQNIGYGGGSWTEELSPENKNTRLKELGINNA